VVGTWRLGLQFEPPLFAARPAVKDTVPALNATPEAPASSANFVRTETPHT
jgi:hypothetical protein